MSPSDAGYPRKGRLSLGEKGCKTPPYSEGTLDVEATRGGRRSQLHQHIPLPLDNHASVGPVPPLEGQLDTFGVRSATKAEIRGTSMPQLQAEEEMRLLLPFDASDLI